MLEGLLRAGMDVARLNFSHGTHAEHARAFETLRRTSKRLGRETAVLADLQGPKIRTGPLAGGRPVRLKDGDDFILTAAECAGDARRVSTTYRRLPREARPGDRILLADGLLELRVRAVRGAEVRCEVVHGGELGQHKGINLPGVAVRAPSLSEKDLRDLSFALRHGADYVAVSFVRGPEDMRAARRALRRLGRAVPLVAKIEKPEAYAALDEVLAQSDGVMVARGDLGVEMSPEKVPVAQKNIILRARAARLPVITATQMLESMTHSPRPTRAEVSDVANAVFDGTSAVMLSGETSVGEYPLETVRMMDRIVREAESAPRLAPSTARAAVRGVPEAVSEAVCAAAEDFRLRCIAVFTESGRSARLIAHYRPSCPIVALSPSEATRRRLSLVWGVLPRRIALVRDVNDLTRAAQRRLLEEGLARRGDVVALVAGTPLGLRGTTNLMKLHVVGEPTGS
jgi:pyruvate kinase